MTESELLEALRARPDDRGLRLVYADLLVEQGDPRGEILILEEQIERAPDDSVPGWRAGAERLLHLTAEHGFPIIPDDPDFWIDTMVERGGGGGYPVQYDVEWGERRYYLRYRWGSFSISDEPTMTELATPDLDLASEGEWTDEETNVVLHVVCDALRDDADLTALVFPDPISADPRHRPGARPRYVVSDAFSDGNRSLRARDRERWWALHRRWERAGDPPLTEP